MDGSERGALDDFWDDVRTHIGDVAGGTATRGEYEAIKQLCGRLFGYRGEEIDPDLNGVFVATVIRPNGERPGVGYLDWGEILVQFVPYPKFLPAFRVWYLAEEGKEFIIGLCPVDDVPEGEYPDLTTIIQARIKRIMPDCYVELRR